MNNTIVKLDTEATEYSCLRNVILDLYNDYVVSSGGYIVPEDTFNYHNKTFNRISLYVTVPGLVRIGIVEDNHLVYWLVQDFVAYTGLHEWDVVDTILMNSNHKLYVESRVGVSGCFSNMTGEPLTVNNITYPEGATTGSYATRTLDSIVNNEIFKSQNKLTTSARFTCNNGNINIGISKRDKKCDIYYNRVVENLVNWSKSYDEMSDTLFLFVPPLQSKLKNKRIYAIKLDVAQRGDLVVYLCKGKSKEEFKVLKQWSLFIRALGLQTIRLPEDIILEEDEYIAVSGLNEDSCRFYFGQIPEWQNVPFNSTTGYKVIRLKDYESLEYLDIEIRDSYLNVCLIERGEKISPLEDMVIAITGDSISSYKGFITQKDDIPEGNPLRNNFYFYPNAAHGLVNNIDTMWWGILAKNCRMRVLRNDAWSGSKVSGSDLTALSSDVRLSMLNNVVKGYSTIPKGNPELILCMIGTNDLSSNVPLGSKEDNETTLLGAFNKTCKNLGKYNCSVVYLIIHRGTNEVYKNDIGISMKDYETEATKIAESYNQYFIPSSWFKNINYKNVSTVFNLTGTWTKDTYDITGKTDTIHPNAQAMNIIAEGVREYLEEKCIGLKEQ